MQTNIDNIIVPNKIDGDIQNNESRIYPECNVPVTFWRCPSRLVKLIEGSEK
jgi:hypothetical protein